ncbi:uncharacterized protein LOC135841096 [Planococcus citri]|uniref:uncharacterized protein LOC135841096 n=1 Tax=Planococcus citri TaxID=170843 RepID=UPI0031F8A6BE
MSTADNMCCSCADDKNINSDLSGIKLFKSMVRRVRQKISESKLVKSPSGNELTSVINKTERMSLDESSSGNRSPTDTAKSFCTTHTGDDCKSRMSGYSSDSGTEKSRRSSRVRIRQKVRSRSKSDGRRIEKKPKKILRAPPTYIYVRGLSGIPTQRIRVR